MPRAAVILLVALLMASVASMASMAGGSEAPPAAGSDHASAATDRGVRFLVSKQDEDGAWRSGVHGSFRDGPSLTPHVLRAMVQVAGDQDDPRIKAAIARGRAYLAELPADAPLRYPTYFCADALIVLGDEAKLLDRLRSRQLPEGHVSAGGWAYPAGPLVETVEANLSATAYAVVALRRMKVPVEDSADRKSVV